MSYKAKHPLKTEAVAVFGGLAGVAAGLTAWLTDDLEPWLHAGITGAVALVVAFIARSLVWAQRSVDELQGDHLTDDELTEEMAKGFEALSSGDQRSIEPGETIHITDD